MGLRCSLAPISEILPPAPIFWQAEAQVRLFLVLPLTRTVPSTASRSSGWAPSAGAAASKSLARALTPDLRVAEDAPPTVVDPPEAPPGGRLLSPMTSLIWPIWRPRVSAATWVIMVRVPVPRSWVPISSSTEPSGLMVVRAVQAWPAPPQALTARPRPRRTAPFSEPHGFQSLLHSESSAAFFNWY